MAGSVGAVAGLQVVRRLWVGAKSIGVQASGRTVRFLVRTQLGQGEPLAADRWPEVTAQGDRSLGLPFGSLRASTSATSFWKSARLRRASKSGSFLSPSLSVSSPS